jgi:acyl carrier protein
VKTSKRIQRFIDDELLDGASLDGDPLATGLLDSLSIEQLIAFVEDTFDIMFEDEELIAENFGSIEAVTRLVDDKRKARA